MSERETGLSRAATAAAWGQWVARSSARWSADVLRDYYDGTAGIPSVEESSTAEVRTLARQSVVNMCRVVVDAFARGLSVAGFRSPAQLDDEPGWSVWQANRLDARQVEAHLPALLYGSSYALVLRGQGEPGAVVTLHSPVNVQAHYASRRDVFPELAVIFTPVGSAMTVMVVDRDTVTEGVLAPGETGSTGLVDGMTGVRWMRAPWPHGATFDGQPVCPVVKFANQLDPDGHHSVGEVAPLVTLQQAINSVNFDRLCVSRFAAFRQKVIIGWTGTEDELRRTSVHTVWGVDGSPQDIDVKTLDVSPLEPYNTLLREMKEQVALQAGIPLYQATGNLSNVSTETAALAEAAYQRKLDLKRDSFGESWENVLRLAVQLEGGQPPSAAAEVVWRETQARSFGAVVDGLVKLATVPPEQVGVLSELLYLVPGMTQQRIDAIRMAVKRNQAAQLVGGLVGSTGRSPATGAGAVGDEPVVTA